MKRLTLFFGIFIISLVLAYYFKEDTKTNEKCTQVYSENNEKRYVYPMGKIIGLKATTEGVLVIGYEDDNFEYIGGIKVGDSIIEINGEKIQNVNQIPKILQNVTSENITVKVKRDGNYEEELVKIKNDNGKRRLGFWVRDKISGMGTITLYDPKSKKFKGIGHPITDTDTNELLEIKSGKLYNPKSINIIKSSEKNIGYIDGDFDFLSPIGSFYDNNNYGINANLNIKNNNNSLVEVASKEDVKIGDAYILFEDKNRNISTYSIKIKDLDFENSNNRQIMIEITDKDLLDYTGGIIQGMSGSPIIQNNKIIGALTHVSKDDKKKGYCIFIDEMLE